jgi:adenylate kinase
MRLTIMGPQGAGKGTQAVVIAEKMRLTHISTGDIFRQNMQKETPLGKQAKGFIDKGELVPDEITLGMVKDRLNSVKGGFIFDGFPRTLNQAEALEEFTHIDKAINIAVADEDVVRRVLGRRICSCGAFFNVNIPFLRPKKADICDKCGKRLIQRDDDNEEALRNRLKAYNSQTRPLIEFYRRKGVLLEIDGTGTPDEVTVLTLSALEE